MAQLTLADGDYPTASQLNTYALGEGNAWTSWTPTVTQSGSVTVTNTRSRYARYGRTIIATFNLAVTGTGTTANAIVVSLPVTAAASGSGGGAGKISDTGTAVYVGYWELASTTTVQLVCHNETSAAGIDPAFALASGDGINGTIIYEAAS
jgi:hypothetical protein